ncbi:MAG: hypothetical protein AAGK97_10810, partial [Bacteroidota bacterium]
MPCLGIFEYKLEINKSKSKCIIFNRRERTNETTITLDEDTFEIVEQYRYLGHIIQYNLSDISDVQLRLNSFYAKFNWLFRNFRNTSIDVFYFLFRAFCTPEYGLSLWNLEEIHNKRIFRTFEVAFHNALKKILGVSISTSNHAVADIFNQLLLIHYITLIQIRYYKRIFKSNNVIIKSSLNALKQGCFHRTLYDRMQDKYGCDLRENGMDIL